MGEDDFESGWAEGAALSTDEATPTRSADAPNANDPPAAGHR